MIKYALILGLFSVTGYYTGFFESIQKRADVVFSYEQKSLELARENRILKMKVAELEGRLVSLKEEEKPSSRAIASVPKFDPNDLVQQDVYKWDKQKLKEIGDQSLARNEYEKSAQFYNAYLNQYEGKQGVDQEALYKAGVASYKTEKHYDWAISHFNSYIKNNKASSNVRGAKLWLALSHYKMGDTKNFIEVCKEFRTNYRNTNEWKILSKYYEAIMEKHDYGKI